MRRAICWAFVLLLAIFSCGFNRDHYDGKKNLTGPATTGFSKQKLDYQPLPHDFPDDFYITKELEVHGAQSQDDGQESTSEGYVNTFFNYIELRVDLDRWGGAYRFPNIKIPPGAIINSAYISLVNYVNTFRHPVDSIACEDVDSANSLTSGNGSYDISSRWNRRTNAAVLWNDYINCIPGVRDSTPDLKDLVQEIVDRPGWKSGNAIIFIFKCLSLESDTSHLELYSWDFSDHTYGALLHVTYSAPRGIKKRVALNE